MARLGLLSRIPIWVRVPGIIALVLVGVLISTMLLDSGGVEGGHGSGDEAEMSDHNGDTGGGDGSHGRSGDETETRDHNGSQTGLAAPSDPDPAE